MRGAPYRVAQVLEAHGESLAGYCNNAWQARTLHAIRKCRTAALGGHIDRCQNPECGKLHLSYNSCRNRHCPTCQGHKREQWIRAREKELLNVPYFHVVFTLPDTLNGLCLCAPKEMYGLLFKTAWSVVRDFGVNPRFLGAHTGMVAILHTWGQNLCLHPHLHCIVPGGGITASGKWKHAKNKGKFLFPVKALSKVFRARFVQGLKRQHPHLEKALIQKLFEKDWVVYCKRPFFGPPQVVEYLGRYTHRIAISNHRLKNLDGGQVVFSVKDYRRGGKTSLMCLPHKEFIRRFALHILPRAFVRIRHYGILSSCKKNVVLPLLREQVGAGAVALKPPLAHRSCPECKTGRLVTLLVFGPRGPPARWLQKLEEQGILI